MRLDSGNETDISFSCSYNFVIAIIKVGRGAQVSIKLITQCFSNSMHGLMKETYKTVGLKNKNRKKNC